MFVTRQPPVTSNGKAARNELGRITVFALLRSVIGQHKTPFLFLMHEKGELNMEAHLSPQFNSGSMNINDMLKIKKATFKIKVTHILAGD